MPHMHGEELAAALKRISPATRVIMLTGYSGEEVRATSSAVDAVILKPVTHSALRADHQPDDDRSTNRPAPGETHAKDQRRQKLNSSRGLAY